MSCCSRLLWDPKSKMSLWCVAFSLGAGPHRASANFACNLKIRRRKIFEIFKGFTWKNVFLSLLKSKNWRDTQNKFVFPLSKSKTVLPVFEKLKKNTKHTLILKFLCDNCSLMYKKGFCKFSKTYHFKVPVIFWKWKLCQSRCKICRFFWNWTYKNITNRQPSAHFVNCKKMKITPP